MTIHHKYGFTVPSEFKCWTCIKTKLTAHSTCRIGFHGNWDVILNIVAFITNHQHIPEPKKWRNKKKD